LSVSAQFQEFLVEQMAGFGPVTIRPMFGGAGIYHDGLMFALVYDEALYLKVDEAARSAFEAENLPPFVYSMKGGKKIDMSYFRCPERCLDDADEMAQWCRVAFGVALKAKASKKPKNR
jgi:DNA transformation protein